ncbi:MAG: hypothetical protein IJV56_11030 [Neisseriaceae bacterium]|nr:hypothetical protein [Neisseriaceae bacterium]MBQ9725847.1 hypothetical protein [Neisseriaceae bacterium]
MYLFSKNAPYHYPKHWQHRYQWQESQAYTKGVHGYNLQWLFSFVYHCIAKIRHMPTITMSLQTTRSVFCSFFFQSIENSQTGFIIQKAL